MPPWATGMDIMTNRKGMSSRIGLKQNIKSNKIKHNTKKLGIHLKLLTFLINCNCHKVFMKSFDISL